MGVYNFPIRMKAVTLFRQGRIWELLTMHKVQAMGGEDTKPTKPAHQRA